MSLQRGESGRDPSSCRDGVDLLFVLLLVRCPGTPKYSTTFIGDGLWTTGSYTAEGHTGIK